LREGKQLRPAFGQDVTQQSRFVRVQQAQRFTFNGWFSSLDEISPRS
jgi:hypothetical protein